MSSRQALPPRRSGGLRTFAAVVGAFVVLAGLGAGGVGAYYSSEVSAAHRVGQGPIALSIPPGTSTSGVADLLVSKGVIGNALVFSTYVRLHGLSLEAGQYSIPAGATVSDVAALLAHNQTGTSVRVTIPEGYTARQVGALMAKKGLFSADDFLAATRQPYPQDFLVGHDPSLGLDGYLFPDTYDFAPRVTPKEVITVLLNRFGEKLTPDLRTRLPAGYTLNQVVVMASIVEREAFFDKDRAAVAGVFYNRLAARMPLQSDATVAYAKGQAGADITEDDKKLNSPYNTYLNPGLPPGGISNPGMPSIMAALQPQKTGYYYYLTDKVGHAHFSTTYAQHQQCQVNLSVCPTLP